MGIFKPLRSLFGWVGGGKKQPINRPAATFTPTGPAKFTPTEPATFEPVQPPYGKSEAEENSAVDELLGKMGRETEEGGFLDGTPKHVISSTVSVIQYIMEAELLYVTYKDGSQYEYSPVSPEMAMSFYRAPSYGKWVWNNLRVRGTVFGYQVDYRLVSGNRVWHAAGADSIARHEAIPKAGEPWAGYHPSMSYKGAKGAMGAKGGGVNLGKRGGSKKVAHFVSAKARPS